MKRFNALDKLKNKEEQQRALKKMKADSLLMEDRLSLVKLQQGCWLVYKRPARKTKNKIYVDKNNEAKIELLGEDGKPVK